MKTVLTELIEKYQKEWDKNGMGASISISSLISELKSKLPKERQDLIDARQDGHNSTYLTNDGTLELDTISEQYVYEKFGI